MAHNIQLNSGSGGDITFAYDTATGGVYSTSGKIPGSFLAVSPTGSTPPVPVTGTNPLPMSEGGSAYAAVAAGAGTVAVVAKASPGRLARVVVVALGTAAVSIYDNASAATGTILFTVPASAPTGTVYNLQLPAVNGITVGQVLNSPLMLVTYF